MNSGIIKQKFLTGAGITMFWKNEISAKKRFWIWEAISSEVKIIGNNNLQSWKLNMNLDYPK